MSTKAVGMSVMIVAVVMVMIVVMVVPAHYSAAMTSFGTAAVRSSPRA